MTAPTASVQTGLDVLLASQTASLRGRRIGLLTHCAAIDSRLQYAITCFHQMRDIPFLRLFAPEHGLFGHAQDLEGVVGTRDPLTGLPIISLYGNSIESLRPTTDHLTNLDLLVVDLVDVGSRYYTFQATMLYCLEKASEMELPVWILDRPNPLGGETVEGPLLRQPFFSFVGPQPTAIRHGMTLGELARMYHARLGLRCELRVIPCQGWRRSMYSSDTGLPWVQPSPNMPTPETALVYPGQCLLEGTNLSEGRGTTRPFEICGSPSLDAVELAARLNAETLPGVYFRPLWFRPTFQKFAGQMCAGAQLHITNRESYQPVRTSLALLGWARKLLETAFVWRTETYEFVSDRPAIDLLFGSDRERLALEADIPWRDIADSWRAEEESFRNQREPFLLYE